MRLVFANSIWRACKLAAQVYTCLALASSTAVAQRAQLMPHADRSLLLDIVSTGEHLVAVGERGHILRRLEDSDEWQQVQVPSRQMLTAVCFADDKRGWAVGHDGVVLGTVDGGYSWALQYQGLNEQPQINREALDRLLREKASIEQAFAAEQNFELRHDLLGTLDELMLDIEDAKLALTEPPYTPPLLDVFCRDMQHVYAVGAFGSVLQTNNGGATWQRSNARVENPDQYHLNSITGSEDGRLWIAGESGLIFSSADAGASWEQLDSPYFGSFFGVEYQSDSDTLLVFGLRGNVYRSVDAGRSWQASAMTGQRTLAGGLWLNQNYALLVGSVGNIQLSTDGGLSFRDISLEQRVNLSAIAVHKGQAFAVGQGGSYSLDGLGVSGD